MSYHEKMFPQKSCSAAKDQFHPKILNFSELNKNPKILSNSFICPNLVVDEEIAASIITLKYSTLNESTTDRDGVPTVAWA